MKRYAQARQEHPRAFYGSAEDVLEDDVLDDHEKTEVLTKMAAEARLLNETDTIGVNTEIDMFGSNLKSVVAALSGNSDADDRVVAMASHMTASSDAHVHFVSVVRQVTQVAAYGALAPVDPAIAAGETTVESIEDAIVERTRSINENLVGSTRPEKYSVEVKSGLVDDEIIRAADEHDAQMILIGFGEKTWFEGILSADVATQVTKKSSRPVLIVPEQSA